MANILEYVDTKKAITAHVDDDYKKKLEELMGINSISIGYHERTDVYINEPGLYKLIFRSKMKEAETFTDWVFFRGITIHSSNWIVHDQRTGDKEMEVNRR